MTEKRITYAHTFSVAENELRIQSGKTLISEVRLIAEEDCGGDLSVLPNKILAKIPMLTAEARLAARRRNPTFSWPNTPIPTAPRKKAGPQLLQNRDNRLASFCEQTLCSTSCATALAPAG